jgi:3-dehydroquinate dehydratase-2
MAGPGIAFARACLHVITGRASAACSGANAMTLKVLVLNGPNLNLLGKREVDIYGRETLADIETAARLQAGELGLELEFRQSNHEGELVDWIQEARGRYSGLIVNAGAYSHSSVAILDALLSVEMPIVEVHLSNIFQRESFRRRSYVSQAARGIICGFGAQGYLLALVAMAKLARPVGAA